MGRVLLTGASGFVAAHVLDSFLRNGHFVRFTVRSQEKADQILQANAKYKDQLESVIVPGNVSSLAHITLLFHPRPQQILLTLLIQF
jgi:nucleoside-diphosphate-sugar epimerase